MRELKNQSAPAPLDTAHTHCGHCSCTLARQGQRAAQLSGSAYITLPVLGSMRLPATKPVVGSVPLGRRKSRMCGSGLAAAGAGAGSEGATRWRMRQGSGGSQGMSRWWAPVDGIVHPPAALLHAHATPLGISQQPPLGCALGNVLGQDDVTARGGAERRRV